MKSAIQLKNIANKLAKTFPTEISARWILLNNNEIRIPLLDASILQCVKLNDILKGYNQLRQPDLIIIYS